MNTTINNKRYDTDRARLIGSINNKKKKNDPFYISESLYCKKTGEYFLHCCGGSETKYAKIKKRVTISDASKSEYNEAIILLSEDDAKKWARTNLSEEIYKKQFEKDENDKSHIYITIEQKYHDKLKYICCLENINYSEFMRRAIEQAMKQEKYGDDN